MSSGGGRCQSRWPPANGVATGCPLRPTRTGWTDNSSRACRLRCLLLQQSVRVYFQSHAVVGGGGPRSFGPLRYVVGERVRESESIRAREERMQSALLTRRRDTNRARERSSPWSDLREARESSERTDSHRHALPVHAGHRVPRKESRGAPTPFLGHRPSSLRFYDTFYCRRCIDSTIG